MLLAGCESSPLVEWLPVLVRLRVQVQLPGPGTSPETSPDQDSFLRRVQAQSRSASCARLQWPRLTSAPGPSLGPGSSCRLGGPGPGPSPGQVRIQVSFLHETVVAVRHQCAGCWSRSWSRSGSRSGSSSGPRLTLQNPRDGILASIDVPDGLEVAEQRPAALSRGHGVLGPAWPGPSRLCAARPVRPFASRLRWGFCRLADIAGRGRRRLAPLCIGHCLVLGPWAFVAGIASAGSPHAVAGPPCRYCWPEAEAAWCLFAAATGWEACRAAASSTAPEGRPFWPHLPCWRDSSLPSGSLLARACFPAGHSPYRVEMRPLPPSPTARRPP